MHGPPLSTVFPSLLKETPLEAALQYLKWPHPNPVSRLWPPYEPVVLCVFIYNQFESRRPPYPSTGTIRAILDLQFFIDSPPSYPKNSEAPLPVPWACRSPLPNWVINL